jgi:hypothetical protein
MRLAADRERAADNGRTLKLYYAVVQRFPDTPDVETALCRMAQLYWNAYRDAPNARRCVEVLLQGFPYSPMAAFGQSLLRQMGPGGVRPLANRERRLSRSFALS